jgi:hypothetical protein
MLRINLRFKYLQNIRSLILIIKRTGIRSLLHWSEPTSVMACIPGNTVPSATVNFFLNTPRHAL